MDSPIATVMSVDEGSVLLRVDGAIACARCAAGKGCGAGLLGSSQASREFHLPSPPGLNLAAGERVRLELLPARLLQATLYAYGLPLAALTLVPLVANRLWGPLGDAQLVLVAAGAIGAAVLAGRRLLARKQCLDQLVPDIAGRAPAVEK